MEMTFKEFMGVLWESDGCGVVITDWELVVDYWVGTFQPDDDTIEEVKVWSSEAELELYDTI